MKAMAKVSRWAKQLLIVSKSPFEEEIYLRALSYTSAADDEELCDEALVDILFFVGSMMSIEEIQAKQTNPIVPIDIATALKLTLPH